VQKEQLTLPIGTTIRDPSGGSYVIEGLLGKGGFGAVYLVRDRRARQDLFALKELLNPNTPDHERFVFEGELLKRLHHRALPRVYRVFEHEKLKRVYLLMDYVKGMDLEALREEQPERRFSLPVVLALMTPIVDAIIYLHHQDPPVVHRDIKPANIIVPVGAEEAILVDFGSAKQYLMDATTNVIRHGSPGYAALEQYGSGTSPQTDIYGLGATLYTLLTGVIPPDAITRAGASKRFDPLEPAHLIVPEVSWAVATAIERAMSISTADRFETVGQFWQELTAHAPQQQELEPSITSLSSSRPQSGPYLATISPASSRRRWHLPDAARRIALLLVLLALFISGIVGTIYLIPRVNQISHSPASRKITPAPTHPHPTVTSVSFPYPHMADSYSGTVADIMNNEKSAMFLTHLQQNQGHIRGDFQGLGLVGTFTGTVNAAGQVHFVVKVTTSDETLAFEGDIKVGGDIVGTFNVLDHNGSQTGESGLWNVAASPQLQPSSSSLLNSQELARVSGEMIPVNNIG